MKQETGRRLPMHFQLRTVTKFIIIHEIILLYNVDAKRPLPVVHGAVPPPVKNEMPEKDDKFIIVSIVHCFLSAEHTILVD